MRQNLDATEGLEEAEVMQELPPCAKCQFSHKSVNLSFIITNMNIKSTDLYGIVFLNAFMHNFCETKSGRHRGARNLDDTEALV